MTVEKEAILDKHWKHSTIWDAGDGHSKVDCVRCCYEKNAYAAMDEYSSSLLKENEELKQRIGYQTSLYEGKFNNAATFVEKRFPDKDPSDQMIIADGIVEANYQLQSSNEAKDREIAALKERMKIYNDLLFPFEVDGVIKLQKEREYWKARCEAAEVIYQLLNSNIDHKQEYKTWQALKQPPIK